MLTAKLDRYSPLMLGASFSLTYGMSFAALVSTVVHVALFYGKDIWARARRATSEEADIHLKLMRKYREVPELWFASVFLVSFAFGMIACQVWETHLAWWAYIICVLIGVFFILPVGTSTAERSHRMNPCSHVIRGDSGYHEPADGTERDHGTHYWLYATGAPFGHDAIQELGLYE